MQHEDAACNHPCGAEPMGCGNCEEAGNSYYDSYSERRAQMERAIRRDIANNYDDYEEE